MKALRNFLLPKIARKVRRDRLTYLSPEKLKSLISFMKKANANGVKGNILEMGIALGGSGIVLASIMGERAFYGYDVFGLIPPPSDVDGKVANQRFETIKKGQSRGLKSDVYYGYRDNLLDEVRANFSRYGYTEDGKRINFVPGLFEDTLPHDGPPIALAHIDCDWHDPVKLCLERLGPRISIGGFIVLDDYNDYDGCRKATDDFLEHAPFKIMTLKPHAVLMRV
ncbi:MAG: TylF/MycF/NovP-related O-methyltransferase [Hyphomicrobiales bacterium]